MHLAQYWELTKPRVIALIVFTAIIGMFLSVSGPRWVDFIPPWRALVFGSLGIWLAAASAAAINHLLDRRIEAGQEHVADHHDLEVVVRVLEALDHLALAGPVELRVADLGRVVVGGRVEHRELRRPELAQRFIFMTGGAFTENARDFLEHTSCQTLSKPFTVANVYRVVEQAVEQSRSANAASL